MPGISNVEKLPPWGAALAAAIKARHTMAKSFISENRNKSLINRNMLKLAAFKHTQINVALDNMAYLLDKGFGPTIC